MKTTVILDGPGTVLYERRRAQDVKPVGDEEFATVKVPAVKGNVPNKEYKIPPPPVKKANDTLQDPIGMAQAVMSSLNKRLKVCKTPEEQKALSAKIKRLQAALSTVGAPAHDSEDTPFERAMAKAQVGNRVTLKSGFGYHFGQNFSRLSRPISGVIEAKQGSDIYVRVDGEQVRWKFPLMAIET